MKLLYKNEMSIYMWVFPIDGTKQTCGCPMEFNVLKGNRGYQTMIPGLFNCMEGMENLDRDTLLDQNDITSMHETIWSTSALWENPEADHT